LFTIIGTFDIPLFEKIKPFLFTTYTIVWRNLFDQPLDGTLIQNALLILIIHILGFVGYANYYFNKKDFLN